MQIRSGYSFRTAVGHLEDVADRVKEIGWERWPLCDRMSTFGFARATKLAKARGLSMIYGVEIPCVYELGDKKPVVDCWSFFAIDSLRPLHDLIGMATDNPGKEPSLTYSQALNVAGVVAVAGERLLVDRLPETLPGHFFASLAPSTPIGLVRRAIRRQLPFIATSDNYYPRPEDLEFYRVTLGRRAGTQTYPRHIMGDDELKACLLHNDVPPDVAAQAFHNRDWAMDRCRATLKQATLLSPEKPMTLRQMCELGAVKRGVDLTDPVYKERLDRELSTIVDKEFEDYFYILADLMAFAKENMVIGPARGSSCGSLVCYLLEITAVDPIPYGLIFERFIDLNRKDLPDIDADFSDAKRHLVFEYAEQKYGKDRVARLGTVGMFKAKSALNQAGMSLQIPKWRTDKLADSIIERSSGDSRVMNSLEDTLLTTDAGRAIMKEHPEVIISARMEGHPSVSSQHAAGLLLTQEPIAEFVAVNARTRAAWCDKKDAEALNLLKVDALGLTQLSVFERTLELIGERPTSHYLERIPFADPLAFAVLNKKQYAGIFQFTGTALRSLANQITFEKLDDLVAMTALARPGPLASGGAMAWINRRNGEPVPPPLHPLLGELTADTHGVVMYQETVMKITRELGQFSWADTAAIRKLMSNRSGDEAFRRFEDQFLQGATDNGMTREAALTVWKQVDTMGSWAFNKCIAGSTKIKIASTGGLKGGMTVAELYEKYEAAPSAWIRQRGSKPVLLSLEPDGRARPQKAVRIIKNGPKRCTRYRFDDGSEVECTSDHRFIINGQWQPARTAHVGDEFTFVESHQQPYEFTTGKGHAKGKSYKVKQEGFAEGEGNPAWVDGRSKFFSEFRDRKVAEGAPCEDCDKLKSRMEAHHLDFAHGKVLPKDLAWLCAGCHKKRHYAVGRSVRWGRGSPTTTRRLVSAEDAGIQETYDIEMPAHHNFALYNGLVTHNSHAVAYGIVSYWCCWMKAHFPMEFAAATLDAEADPAKQLGILRELDREGIKYKPLDPDHSTHKWEVAVKDSQKILVGPLTAIKGIGPSKVNEVIASREANKALRPALRKLLEQAKTEIDSLNPISDRVKALHPDLAKINIFSTPWAAKDVQAGVLGEVMIFAVVVKISPRSENEAINIQKRGGRVLTGPTESLNLFFRDDTDEIFCKVDRFAFERLGRPILERAGAGKALYAIKGTVPPNFRMIQVKAVRYLGTLD